MAPDLDIGDIDEQYQTEMLASAYYQMNDDFIDFLEANDINFNNLNSNSLTYIFATICRVYPIDRLQNFLSRYPNISRKSGLEILWINTNIPTLKFLLENDFDAKNTPVSERIFENCVHGSNLPKLNILIEYESYTPELLYVIFMKACELHKFDILNYLIDTTAIDMPNIINRMSNNSTDLELN